MSHRFPEPIALFADLGEPTADNQVYISTGIGVLALESGATLRTSLGLAIGTDVQAWDAQLDDLAALAVTDGNIIVGDGANWVVESGATARTSLGVAIGSDVQAWDVGLDDLAALSVADGNFIVGDGANWTVESGATARTSLGLGTGDSPTFTNLTLTGDIVVQGSPVRLESETVRVNDNTFLMNANYVTASPEDWGIAGVVQGTATTDTVSAYATGTTITTAGSGTFGANDYVQLTGSGTNDAIYRVASHVGTTLTIATSGDDATLINPSLNTSESATGTITKVEIAGLRYDASAGTFEFATAASTGPLVYTPIDTGLLGSDNTWTGTQDFQDTITTDAVKRNVRTIGASVSALSSDHIVIQTSGGNITYTLPAATGSGREIVVKKRTTTGSGDLTIDGSGAETIDGSTTISLKRINESVTLIDYGSGIWSVH